MLYKAGAIVYGLVLCDTGCRLPDPGCTTGMFPGFSDGVVVGKTVSGKAKFLFLGF